MDLGVYCWCLDLQLNINASPDERAGRADAGVVPAVVAAARDCRLKGQPIASTPIDGLKLLALPGRDGVIVADLSCKRAPQVPADLLVSILNNYHTDLNRAATDHLAIGGFSASLSQSYEEINLLFRMATSLTSTDDPRRIVQLFGNELREVLCYGWLAVAFQAGESVLESLRGLIQYSGRLPCKEPEFHSYLGTIPTSKKARVLSPTQNVLAAKAGSELIAQSLMHDGVAVGVIVAGNRGGTDPDVSSDELQFTEAAARFLGLFHQNARRFADQRQQFLGTLKVLTAAVDAKDPYTRGHSERVASLGAQLATKLGFNPETIEAIRVAGLLHDIGKIGVPEAILRKPGKLTDEEFDFVKKHPEIGYRILKDLPSLSLHLPGVLHHHERWDGRGYPYGLRGAAIPMVARILAFADTFDAMSSNRSYRCAMARPWILEEIRKGSGTQFDPQLVELFTFLDFAEFDKLLISSAAAA